MNSNNSSRYISIVLIAFTALILAVLPIRVQFVSNEVAAEETTVVEAQSQTSTRLVQDTQTRPGIVEYTLRTAIGGTPAMAFVGVGGEIDAVSSPELKATVGDTVRITVINGDPMMHDLKIDEFGVYTGGLLEDEQTVVVEFVADKAGTFSYYCSVPGHRAVGMEGKLTVVEAPGSAAVDSGSTDYVGEAVPVSQVVEAGPAAEDAVSISRNPADVPVPVGDREPQTLQITLNTVEINGILADGTTYRYMTFDGQVPGPMLRVRVGDTVELTLNNQPDSQLAHSIDLHAVTGPGGGAVYTQTLPGGSTSFTFQAINPGLYVYHCATPSVAHHITSGMYGLILVEPEGGLPPVDREFYIMQGELYTAQPFGTQGHLDFSHEAMLDEDAEYFVFNGAANALTLDEFALHAKVGESVRIFFGVGGPNAVSSFHVIGEIFDRVYDQASLTSEPLTDVQTTLVPSGGATMVEFTLDVPGRYILVDHALSRLERGLAGYLYAEGEENPVVFHSEGGMNDAGH
jgi:nitrite reductase (NO-forming)